jgi:chemosensory pili system protein ChpC
MSAADDELYSLLVPLREGRLLLPRACVAEVVRYQPPMPVPRSPAWLRGTVHWGDRRVPVVCFEELLGQTPGQPGGRTRIALVQGITGRLSTGVFGILTEGFPQLVRVNRDVLELEERHAWPDPGPVVCQIRMINEHPLIPDLESIEALLADALDGVPAPLT